MAEYIPPRRIPTRKPDPTPEPLIVTPSDLPKRKKSASARDRREAEILQSFYEAVALDRLLGEAENAEKSLRLFLKLSWSTVNPGVPFQDAWFFDCLCEHLEALVDRQIRKLIINIMPRTYKSGLCSIHFPAWVWISRPHEKFLCASFGRLLSRRHSNHCRNLIKSKWYQDRWAKKFAISRVQDEKIEFENDKGGVRIAGSVEAGVLGSGGNFRIYDDPNDLDRMLKEPETYPQTVREWYSNTASSRNIDPTTDCQLCIQQRSGYGNDLTEYLLELGGWDQLVIPNEYDGRKFLGPLAFTDPRTHVGELLCPERLPIEEVEDLKRAKKVHYAGQYNQVPAVIGKSGLKREWWKFYVPKGKLVKEIGPDGDERIKPVRITLSNGQLIEQTPIELPAAFQQIVHSLDCTFKNDDDNDFVADHVWGRLGANTFLLHREHGHWNFPETLAVVRRVTNLFPSPEKLVEDKANGPAVIQSLKNEIPGLIAVNPEGGKWSRVAAISGYVEAGNVYLPSPDLYPWVWELIAEFAAGQSAKHDDDTDAMSQALKRLYDAQAQSGLPEFRVQPLTGEPTTACHIVTASPIPSDWRKFVAVVPNRAAIWLAEHPVSSAMRVYRELDIERMDAVSVGQSLASLSLADLTGTIPTNMSGIVPIRRPSQSFADSYDIFLPKLAFAVIESVGCWAELMESAILSWEKPDADWETRKQIKELVRASRFRSEMIEEEPERAIDRLRELLAFQPPEWTARKYDRKLALALAEKDLNEYHDYMAAVDGKVRGEWPKLKISASCPQLISQMGTVRRDKLDELPPFIEALLLAVSAPKRDVERHLTARPYIVGGNQSLRNQTLLSRKFGNR